MKKYLLPQSGTFYKANMHCHSTYSDGDLSPQELKEIYKAHGYAVLAITDHESIFDHSNLNDDTFLTIPAYEREINSVADAWNDIQTCHLCFYPKDKANINNIAFDPDFIHPKFRWMHTPELKAKVTYLGAPYQPHYDPESINYIVREAKKYGFLVTLNHLQWSQERYDQFSRYEGIDAVEVYNHASAKIGWDMDDSLYYDALLHRGKKMRCVCTDDNHSESDCCGGWIMLKAEMLTHESILAAFENGDFYSSFGPEIKDLYVEDGKVYIQTSPCAAIRFLTGNRLTRLKASENNTDQITCAWFDLKEVRDYFRLEVIDTCGKKSYTNAYFV